MKKLKEIDLWLQIAALVGGGICGSLYAERSLLIVYFLVGGVQVLSFLAHLAAGSAVGLTTGRQRYGWFLIILGSLLLFGWAIEREDLPEIVLHPLLLIAPIVAFLYARMCYNELENLKLVNDENK